MYDDNLHITPGPEKGLPQPEIPADAAWDKMAELLDAQMPVMPPKPPVPPAPSSPAGGGLFGLNYKFWILGTLVTVILGVLIWGVVSFTGDSGSSPAIGGNQLAVRDAPDSMAALSSEKRILPETDKRNVEGSTGTGGEQQPVKKSNDERFNKALPGNAAISKEKPGVKAELPVIETPPLQPASEIGSAEITKSAEVQSKHETGDSIQAPVTVKGITDTATVSNPPTGAIPAEQPGNEDIPPGKGNSGIEDSSPGNFQWQMNLEGGIGQVLQNGRKPNVFFGGMLTAGLWNENLEAGIETGIGWQLNEDYGYMETSIRIDSIPVDTLGHMTYIDTTRTENYTYRYQYLQVPLFLTKQLYKGRKFSFDIKTGLVVGFLITEDRSLDKTYGPSGGLVLDSASYNYTRRDLSWQWQVAPKFRWDINRRLSIVLSPACTFYLNNLYEKNNRPDGIPVGLGINGGVIFKF